MFFKNAISQRSFDELGKISSETVFLDDVYSLNYSKLNNGLIKLAVSSDGVYYGHAEIYKNVAILFNAKGDKLKTHSFEKDADETVVSDFIVPSIVQSNPEIRQKLDIQQLKAALAESIVGYEIDDGQIRFKRANGALTNPINISGVGQQETAVAAIVDRLNSVELPTDGVGLEFIVTEDRVGVRREGDEYYEYTNSLRGKDGWSAYQFWLMENQGTIEQFLNSLVGSDGRNIQFAIDGDRVGFRLEGDSEFSFTPNLTGEQGPIGKSLEFSIDGDRIGVRVAGDLEYQYTPSLKGDKGDKGDDGKSVEYTVDGDKIGIRLNGENEYSYTDSLKGEKGDSVKGDDGIGIEYDVQPYRIGIKRQDEDDFTYTASLKPIKGAKGDKGDSIKGDKGDKGDDGKGLEFVVKGDKIGVRRSGEKNYKFTDSLKGESIKGDDGVGLDFKIDGDRIGIKKENEEDYQWTPNLTGKPGKSGGYWSDIGGTAGSSIVIRQDNAVIEAKATTIDFTGNIPKITKTADGRVEVNIDTKTNQPTGFPNRVDSAIEFNNITREFSIFPTGIEYKVYLRGKEFIKNGYSYVIIPNETGIHYIYFNGGTGVLETTMVKTDDLFKDNAFVSIIYWQVDQQEAIYFAEERHGIVMDGATHYYLHLTLGAQYRFGFDPLNVQADQDGSLNGHAQFGISNGRIADEDLETDVVNSTPQQISPTGRFPVFYRTGDEFNWFKTTAKDYPLLLNGDQGYTGVRPAFNRFNGVEWVLGEVPNNSFVLVHIIATNNILEPVIAVLGNSYHTKSNARENARVELINITGLPFAEFVPIATFIYEARDAYTNVPKARIVSTDGGGQFVDWREQDINIQPSEGTGGGTTFRTQAFNLSGTSFTLTPAAHGFTNYYSYKVIKSATGEDVTISVKENALTFDIQSVVPMDSLSLVIRGF